MSGLQDLRAKHAPMDAKVDIRILNPFFWQWYYDHADDMIIKRKVFVFSVTIRVPDLYPLFVQLFGPEPAHTAFAE